MFRRNQKIEKGTKGRKKKSKNQNQKEKGRKKEEAPDQGEMLRDVSKYLYILF